MVTLLVSLIISSFSFFSGLDDFAIVIGSNTTGSGRSRFKRSVENEDRQNAVNNLMNVVDKSLLDVRQFLNQAEKIPENNTSIKDNAILGVMRLVDQGLIKLKGTFVNKTDTNDTETAIGTLSNVINKGLLMVEDVLDKTTVYSDAKDKADTNLNKSENDNTGEGGGLTEFFNDVKNFYFEENDGKVTLPQDEVKQDNSFVTILKLADQEMFDILAYFGKNQTSKLSVDQASSTTTTEPPKEDSDGPVIKAMKVADQQLKEILNNWSAILPTASTTTTRSSSTTTLTKVDPEQLQLLYEQESEFLKFMRKIDKELNKAKDYLYTAFGTDDDKNDEPEQEDILTKYVPIPIKDTPSGNSAQEVKVSANDEEAPEAEE